MTVDAEKFYADKRLPICGLNVSKSFAQLSEKEKRYTYHLSKASWAGARIIQGQWTPQARSLFDLLVQTFSEDGKIGDLRRMKSASGVGDDEWKDLLMYTAQTLSNLVNYKSFGFSKIVPRTPPSSFAAVVKASSNSQTAVLLWEELQDHIYSLQPEASLTIGKRCEGHVNNYYMGEVVDDAEVADIQVAAEKLGIDVLNTRVEKQNSTSYVLHIASTEQREGEHVVEVKGAKATLKIRHGDFAQTLHKVVSELEEAKKYAANQNQIDMIEGYIDSFRAGSIEDHKRGSRAWVKDIGPVVECYIGFIESYVDPYGGRAEWEGFTAIVDKQLSARYETLVARAPELIKNMPWGKEFEVDAFSKPDFTALEIVNFATGDMPVGINIPNYYEIRESVGFKNVTLMNVLTAKSPDEELTFIHPDEVALFNAWDNIVNEVGTANHELLGHGTGKLFKENADGSKNFDPEKIINPLTGKSVSSWYKPGQTPDSVLGEVSSSFEECRAEATELFLVSNKEILQIFDIISPKDVEDIQYVTFLAMCRNGLRAMQFYDPITKKHGQAHMQARLGIAQHLIRSGIAHLEITRNDSGKIQNIYVRVDRSKVLSEGRSCIGKLLVDLQVRRSTADGAGAREFYNTLTTPLPSWDGEIRDFVLERKQPRKLFVQPNTFVQQNTVQLKEYPLTVEGLIESVIERDL
ncbi:aflatoxin-detoxifizyme [Schizopora paradoxa]|uniref:Dipeptidyl peptidase 3 n=1 Tax=Schizopora paradoxa TaxID=27342 RepID=A0A0H2RX52_9AGAM|nr:aflatoxin-detoxifizyme [Schizopora paradoxa]